ncbi:MAG: A/G-specific adenine glycosylase [Chloroflexi bacterium]|nr:A/G-specific adenine glycosylase [Chloroflexota bacterium]
MALARANGTGRTCPSPPSPEVDLPPSKTSSVQQAIIAWYRREGRDLPWRHTRDPYAILVSEIMLQQTQVDRVLPKYLEFLERYPTLESLAAAPRAEVIRNWAPLGYNLRAVRLHEIARQAVERFGGTLPGTVEALLTLKGIGRYTAAAVACFAYGQAEAVLDTNVRRVLGRIFVHEAPGAMEDDRLGWKLAAAALPSKGQRVKGKGQGEPAAEEVYGWNQALMDLGATICTSRAPRCLLCPVQAWCSARAEWEGSPSSPGPFSHAGEKGSALSTQPLALVAERRVPYAAGRLRNGAAERFEGSRRWYRGRIVDALRALPPGASLDLVEVGRQIKPDYTAADFAWLLDLAESLSRDGLIKLTRYDDGADTLALAD